MQESKAIYLTMAIIGTLVPWYFFGTFFIKEGINLSLFLTNVFANRPAAGFSSDVLISILVFLFWSFNDARSKQIKHWWVIFAASCTVGLSLSLPLYLYLRYDK